MSIPWAGGEVPYLTTDQMIEVDRAMIEDFGVDLVRMMENAGRCLAHLARERFLDGDLRGKTVVVLAGTGGNGGGALVAARRLHGYGAEVRVALVSRERMAPVPAEQLRTVEKLGLPTTERDLPYANADLIIDGLIGYSLKGEPRGRAAELIQWANDAAVPTLALDIPSGVDGTTGEVLTPTIEAAATLTLALPKTGLRRPAALATAGEIYLGDISVPPALYGREPLNLDVGPLFARADVIRIS